MAGFGIGLREDGVELGDPRVRDEPLRPVQDVLAAVAPRLGPHRGRVRARAGLGERVGDQPLATRQPREVARLLLVRACELEPERAQLLDGQDQPGRRADLREFLDRDEHHQRAGAGAAVLLLERKPEQVVLAHQLDHVPGELGRPVDLGRARGHALARELADEVADLALLGAQRIARHESESSPGTRNRSRSRSCRGTRTRARRRSPRGSRRSPRGPCARGPGSRR